MSDICRFPSSPGWERSRAAGPARAERERRVVECLKGGLAMAEIARREGITERGMRESIRNLVARRAPEATGEFIAAPMSRLNQALLVSFGAMSEEPPDPSPGVAAVDRVVRIVRALDLYHGLGGAAHGTETRRKLLESLVSGAEMTAPSLADHGCEERAAGTEADPSPDWAEFLVDALPQRVEKRGTGSRNRGRFPGGLSLRHGRPRTVIRGCPSHPRGPGVNNAPRLASACVSS
jgi:hypothetical protein